MPDEQAMKIVNFGEYCPKCKYRDLPEEEEPCSECLEESTNLYSHKPVNFKKEK